MSTDVEDWPRIRFHGWTNEQLAEYESYLYEREASGQDTWEWRDAVLWEMNRRGMMQR